MTASFISGADWFDQLMPAGLPVPSALMLSGPGGSGKPLIGNVLVGSWLRQGGSVVFISLQYPDPSFIYTALKNVSGLDLDDFTVRFAFIELAPELEGLLEPQGNRIKANVVIPEVWDQALEKACSLVENQGPGILIFASAINLLLFSPTYGRRTLAKLKAMLGAERTYTYLLAASTNAKAEEIAELEDLADHLIVTRSEHDPFRLFMRIERLSGSEFNPIEIQVPFKADMLEDTKEIADHSRQRIIPLVSKI